MNVKTKLDDLKKKVKIIATKRLGEDLINNCSIPNRSFFLIFFFQMDCNVFFVFQLFISHFSIKNDKIYSWKSNRMSEESITPPSTTVKAFVQN